MKTIEFEVSERTASFLFNIVKLIVIAAFVFVVYKGLLFAFENI